MTGAFTQHTYEWLTVDPVAAGASIPEQPPLSPIVEPGTMPSVDAPVDEPMVQITDCGIQLPVPYWQVGWPAAVADTFVRADVARRLVGVAAGLPEPFGLAVLDGWRPLELQRQIYRAAYQNTTLPPGFVSEPSTDPQTPPPHLTGGAVDVTLTYRHRPLALGTLFDAFTGQAASAAFETTPGGSASCGGCSQHGCSTRDSSATSRSGGTSSAARGAGQPSAASAHGTDRRAHPRRISHLQISDRHAELCDRLDTVGPMSDIIDDKAHIRGKIDLSNAVWQRAAGSEELEGPHLEIAFVQDGYVAMRSSEKPVDSETLIFTPAEWEAFVLGAKDGEFDVM